MSITPHRRIQIVVSIGMITAAFLMLRLFTHPAGGWIDESWQDAVAMLVFVATFAAVIAVPFVWLFNAIARIQTPTIYGLSVGYVASLLFFFWLALVGYGHATLGFMLLGVMFAWACWIPALVHARKSA